MIQSRKYSTEPSYLHPLDSSASADSPSSASIPLSWRTPISALVGDDFVLADPWATSHITIEDALSHRTGLPAHDKALAHLYGSGGDRHIGSPQDVTRSLRYLPLNQEPRTTFQYCNLMYAVASHVIETLTGQWLGDVLKEWFWEPLGMKGTYFDLEDARRSPEDFAKGYYWDDKEARLVEVPFMPLEEVSGAGAVISSAQDYVKWVRFLLREENPLSKESHAAIKTSRSFVSSKAGPFDTPTTCTFNYAAAFNTCGCFPTDISSPRCFRVVCDFVQGSSPFLPFWGHARLRGRSIPTPR
jgi:CubicO group peptidase (beta-lactamase class C family)